ncbi:MAG: MmgE/PrpD family protein [Phenylobacterium sp.]|uniref:MmgE/PrpD family protein n=1 Tax=Phenylobacterium sp. TaxID=1871053 RepID=UPI0027306456|nr:MmgE/PrpD family protein [Phenylobacterium sp.]MDP2009829.1 MmgE/PrpD family protein [Phenylobacterium sp.]
MSAADAVGPALSAYIAGSQTAPVPESFRSLGRLHILDTLASIVACRDLAPARLARDFAIAQSGDARRSAATILGTKATAALGDAAFASAMAAHGAEINDFIPSAFVQPGPAVVSVALALAEQRGLSGEAVLRAVITGYELAGRIPKALGVGNLRRAGIANHGIGPVFGGGAAAASILGLPEDRIPDLLTYCAQQAAGSWQWLLDVEHVEKSFVFAGMGARAGLSAALMVEAGFTGVRDSLDHPEGWMASKIFTGGDADRAGLIEGLGERTELIHTAYKRYPVGGPTQPAVKGLLDLLPDLEASAVESVRIEMPGRWQAFRDAAMPALNLRYLTAIMLIDRRLDFVSAQSLERMSGDAAVHALMARVDVVHDPAQETPPGQPRTESARVIVRLKDGAVREVYVPHVVGFPSHPMTAGEVEAKALELMVPVLGAARAAEVVRAVAQIETLPKAADLAHLIAT